MLANVVRWWVILTLGTHWNVRVMDSAGLGVVSNGPFRFVRHPIMLRCSSSSRRLPLIHTAWLTALFGSARARLGPRQTAGGRGVRPGGHADYRRMMAHKPRFVPRLFGGLAPPVVRHRDHRKADSRDEQCPKSSDERNREADPLGQSERSKDQDVGRLGHADLAWHERRTPCR